MYVTFYHIRYSANKYTTELSNRTTYIRYTYIPHSLIYYINACLIFCLKIFGSIYIYIYFKAFPVIGTLFVQFSLIVELIISKIITYSNVDQKYVFKTHDHPGKKWFPGGDVFQRETTKCPPYYDSRLAR